LCIVQVVGTSGCSMQRMCLVSLIFKQKQSASELYRPSDRSLSMKLVSRLSPTIQPQPLSLHCSPYFSHETRSQTKSPAGYVWRVSLKVCTVSYASRRNFYKCLFEWIFIVDSGCCWKLMVCCRVYISPIL
jgi:hypothetical protein